MFVLPVCVIVLLLVLSAFFSGSETALTAVSRGRMFQLEREGSKAAADVNALIANRERLIGALLLGNTFVNILASSLATSLFEKTIGKNAVPVAAGVMTLVILIFSEVLPKTLAIARTDRFALAVAGLLRFLVSILAPIVSTVQTIVWSVLRVFGLKERDVEPIVAPHEEIRGTVDLHHAEGGVEREHRDMIGGVLDLHELKIGDIMTHRKNIVAVDSAAPPREIFEAVLAAEHTRVPVWREQPENIVGILHTKDVVKAVAEAQGVFDHIDMMALVSEPWFVPDTTTLEDQLRAFRSKHLHFAVVVDEYGALQGVVTLEDIVDEIFGDIPDVDEESERTGIHHQPDDSFIIDGSISVRELNRALDWHLPDDEATTLAGFIIHEARTIPDVGQRFAFYGFKFEILRRSRNQITSLRVVPPTSQTPHSA
ncbi:MAG TPA: HlyC/CorC family transporter [Rhizomicrobium sp.]|jgi:Mg2+/Co2+ transporter CorB|nr:HlyC/CorC family transporter [Rhizomicrobium sp.]